MIFIGFILSLGLMVLGVIFANVSPAEVADPVSFILAVCPGLLIVSLSGFFKPFVKGLRVAVSPSEECTPQEAAAGVQAFGLLYKITLGSGFTATLLGFVLMLPNIRDVEIIGRGTSTALLAVLYSLIISYFLWLPIKKVFKSKQEPN